MKKVKEILEGVGAIITGKHFVYQAGEHGPDYVAKDVAITHPSDYAVVAGEISGLVGDLDFGVVCGIEKGAIALGFLVALHRSEAITRDVRYVYAEKAAGPDGSKQFMLGRGFPAIVKGWKVLVVEDVVNTGGSVEAVIAAVRAAGGTVVGVAAICNRGGVTAEQLGVPVLRAALDVLMPKYPADACPLCAASVPIETEFGHGKEFVAEHGQPKSPVAQP